MKIYFLLLCFSQFFIITAQTNIININSDIKLIQLQDSVFIHESWINTDEFGRFPSNGMLAVKNGKALMVDSPYNNELTEQIYDFLKDSMEVKVTRFIGCHYHQDCIGGLEFLKNKNVSSLSLDLTKEKCKELNLPVTENTFSDSTTFTFEGMTVECFFPGGGHTFDNIVVYLPESKILFGGCLIKSLSAKGLGNTTDAAIAEWDKSVGNVINRFPEAEIVIPGHGNYGNQDLMIHTIDLVKEFNNR